MRDLGILFSEATGTITGTMDLWEEQFKSLLDEAEDAMMMIEEMEETFDTFPVSRSPLSLCSTSPISSTRSTPSSTSSMTSPSDELDSLLCADQEEGNDGIDDVDFVMDYIHGSPSPIEDVEVGGERKKRTEQWLIRDNDLQWAQQPLPPGRKCLSSRGEGLTNEQAAARTLFQKRWSKWKKRLLGADVETGVPYLDAMRAKELSLELMQKMPVRFHRVGGHSAKAKQKKKEFELWIEEFLRERGENPLAYIPAKPRKA